MNEISRWSNLGHFAGTPLARATISAPFVAFLIFFNDRIRAYFALQGTEDNLTFWHHMLDIRLEVFYLGLVMLGVSVGLYSILAPSTVSRHKDISDYVSKSLTTYSDNQISASFVSALQKIHEVTGIPDVSIYDAECDAVPKSVLADLQRVVEAEFEKLDLGDIRDGDFPEEMSDFYNFQGYLAIDLILDSLINQRRAQWNIWRPVLSGKSLDKADALRLEYAADDYSHPKLRRLVFVLILISSVITLIPTLITLLQALGTVLRLG
jgi:hypothetical protein